MSEEPTDEELVDRFLKATAGLTQVEAALSARVTQKTVSRWRSGERRALRTSTRQRLLHFLEQRRRRAERPSAVERREREKAEELLSSLDLIARYLGGIAPPGQEKARKLDALEGYRRLITAREVLPSWWYELKERIENEEL